MQQPSIDFAIDLSKQAGVILKEGYGKAHQVTYKGPTDLVTEIDTKAEALLVSRIKAAFPTHTINTEEAGLLQGSSEHCWFIDPVDGTSNYSRGVPMFCVSIGYAFQGKMRLAAVYEPLRDESFYAEKGKGAFLNGSPIHVSETSELLGSMLGTGFPYDMNQEHNNVDNFVKLVMKAHAVRRYGSAVLDQAYVAMGRLDGYWEAGVNVWDIAAGTLLVEEAGGLVTRINGDPDYLKPPYDILAANPVMHRKLLAELKGIP